MSSNATAVHLIDLAWSLLKTMSCHYEAERYKTMYPEAVHITGHTETGIEIMLICGRESTKIGGSENEYTFIDREFIPDPTWWVQTALCDRGYTISRVALFSDNKFCILFD